MRNTGVPCTQQAMRVWRAAQIGLRGTKMRSCSHAQVALLCPGEEVRPRLGSGDAASGDEPAAGWCALMQRCCATAPEERPSFQEIVLTLRGFMHTAKASLAMPPAPNARPL